MSFTSLFDPIFVSCERTDSNLFNEPLNLLSSAVFFLVAWLLWKDYKNNHQKYDEERVTLIVLITLIGTGSIFFHAAANRLGMLLDTAPIAMFTAFVLYVSLRRLLGFKMMNTLLLLIGFAIACWLTQFIPDPYRFNESVAYVMPIAAIAIIACRLRQLHHASAPYFLKATLWFSVSLIFRSIDMIMCQTFPIGTHFLWHLCNGVALYFLAKAIRERRHTGRT